MTSELLTPDNPHLSDPSLAIVSDGASNPSSAKCAINCTSVEAYVRAGVSPATYNAYRADLAHFEAWGGAIPASDVLVASYLAAQASVLAVSTLTRRLAAISVAHGAQGFRSPTSSPLVRATMRGVRREHGTAQKQAKPLLREDLFAVLAAADNSLKDVRDRALLLIGFATGFRRSELTGLDVADLAGVSQGVIITLRQSKTDQEGQGRKIGVPLGRTRWCPVHALQDWLAAAKIERGPVFRPVNRHARVSPVRLSGDAVSAILRDRLRRAGYDPAGYSGHSLRAGLVTSAVQAGVSPLKIRQQTGHASDAMLARYVRDGELFTGNAAGVLL